MKHRALFATLIAATIAAVATTVASSGGHTADQLREAGWECVIPTAGDNLHGTKAIEELGTAERLTFHVFSAATGAYLGTEIVVHERVFTGQPCPTDPPSRQYTDLMPILGIPYYACHRYDSAF